MKNMGLSTDPTLLNVESSSSLLPSSSVSTFLPEEDASICPLLSNINTPSPPPMAFSHPLSANGDSINCGGEDTRAETISNQTNSSNSSGIIGIVGNESAYQHLCKNPDSNFLDNCQKQNGGILNIQITKDTPNFVSWNWPLIRKCTFFVFMSSLLAMCAIVIAMIATIPKTCNPKTAWYKGSVFYEIFPASFQDSNNDGLGDIRGIIQRIDYLESLGIGGIRLNSIFPSQHYPDHFETVTSLTDIDEILGSVNDIMHLALTLHSRNISLILDLELYPYLKQLDVANSHNTSSDITENVTMSSAQTVLEHNNVVTEAMLFWLSKGVDGFYVKGLEHFVNDQNLIDNIAEWKYFLGNDRILIVSNDFLEILNDNYINKILQHIDLVDVHLNVTTGAKNIYTQIKTILESKLKPNNDNGPWIHWSLSGVSKPQRLSSELNSNATLAAILLQLMLPGSPNIFYGDEISLKQSHDPFNEHLDTKHLHHLSTMIWNGTVKFTNRQTLPWLPFPENESVSYELLEEIIKMIELRNNIPSIYKNSFSRDGQIMQNTNIKHSKNDIFVIERYYPRKNSFASISNFGPKSITLDLTSIFYSGKIMIGKGKESKIYFDKFHINSMETVVVKLDK